MGSPTESDPAPPLPSLPDLPGLAGEPSSGRERPSEQFPPASLPDVRGLTPPGGAVAASDVGVEFTGGNAELAAVPLSGTTATAPDGLRPPPPQPAPAVPPPGPVVPVADDPHRRPGAGRMFGGYELVAKIGQGGMGEVYKARQVSLDRVVAIKILSKALYDNEEFIKRFEREAKAIARITHPNIVGVYDFGQLDGLHFMVNEFVDGSSLAKTISDRLLIPTAEFIPQMVQCLSGLGHVGGQGIIHRDIKPDNILITRDGVAKIADFGLAKDVSRKDDNTDLTAAGLAMGTPAYMSPEQCMGQKLDVRSDMYAFGVTAYFALSGQKPFTGNSSFEIMTKQREHTPPPPHELVPGIPRELSAVIMRMLAKKPDDRFPDVDSCRHAWIEIGVQLGVFGRGELETARPRPSQELPALVPLPPPPQTGAQQEAAQVQHQPAAATRPASSPELPAPTAPPAAPARPATASARPGTESVRPERPASERAARRPAPDSHTCPHCGHLNRLDAATCGRCNSTLREGGDGQSPLQQEAEAQRLFEARRYGEAAAAWARLADREGDKRSRSVLRSKERESRKQEHEARIADLRTRAQAAVARGDLRGALAQLEQGREQHRDSAASTTSSSVCDVQLERDIALLRQRLAWRRRMLQIAIATLLLAGAATALVALHQGWFAPTTSAQKAPR